jgi:hypothetical protein
MRASGCALLPTSTACPANTISTADSGASAGGDLCWWGARLAQYGLSATGITRSTFALRSFTAPHHAAQQGKHRLHSQKYLFFSFCGFRGGRRGFGISLVRRLAEHTAASHSITSERAVRRIRNCGPWLAQRRPL